MFYVFLESLFFVSARTQCIYVLTECSRFAELQCLEQLKKTSSTMCFVLDCRVHLSRFSLGMDVHEYVHFTDTANHSCNELIFDHRRGSL